MRVKRLEGETISMKLRNPELRDAERMFIWMHDAYVVENLQTDFPAKTMEDCCDFISNSISKTYIHLTIAGDDDLYMGTVSLKHITNSTAEFAIAICREAMGKGYSIWAMNEMLRIGFEEYGLSNIYWCVKKENKRALRFYDKNHFHRTEADRIEIADGYTIDQIDSYVWYQTTKKDGLENTSEK